MSPSGANGVEPPGSPAQDSRARGEGPAPDAPDAPGAPPGGVGAAEDPGFLFPGEADKEAAE
eukprot:5015806-Alexandrium_andersonii.AAC.1